MKRFTSLMLMLLVAVTTMFAQTLPATDKAFKVENNRGALAINNDGTALIGTPNVAIADVAQKNFAFVQHNGKVYLYSVWASKFVNKDCSLTNSQPVDAITVENVDGGKFFFKYDDAHNVNLGGSGQIAVNDWGILDEGNQFTLVENGDFDPTAALAILDNSCTITYNFVYNDKIVATQTTEVTKGANYHAFTSLPWGAAATVPTGTADADETLEIACTIDASVLPFVPSATYDDANMKWYYVKNNNTYYLSHKSGQDHIALNDAAKTIDDNNKDAFTWAFVGNPFEGYHIVNRATGNTHVLSSSTSVAGNDANVFPVMTELATLANGNNEYWIPTSSSNIANGFYLAQKGFASNRLNNRNGKLAYWTGGADGGSTFTVIERPMGPVAELEALIVEANALKATVEANQGTIIGEYSAETLSTLAAAITTAEAIEDANITASDVETLQAAINAVSVILPTAGKFYQFHSSLAAFAETKAVHGTDGNPGWKTLNNDDKNFYWKAVDTANGIALQNAANGKYLCGNAGQSGAWSLTETPSEIDVKIFSKAENEKGYEYGIILNGWQMHANNHGGGANASGNLVSWNTDNANSASSWYILEVELQEFFTVTYNFKYGEEIKYTHSVELAKGAAFPTVNVALPYGVTTDFAVPEGTVETDATFNFNLTIVNEVPFEAVESGTPTTWYYTRMHGNPAVTSYIQDNGENNVEWLDKSVAADEIDSHLWGFVGNIFDGYKVVNKGSGNAIKSTGSGAATMASVADATVFVAMTSQNTTEGTFCLRYPNGNYLNAQGEGVYHYGDNDNGSSFFLTKYEETNVTVSSAEWATMYLGYAVYVPENVNVYAVTGAENGYVTKSQLEGVIPAKTGVLLENAGTYTFKKAIATEFANVEGNLMKGSVEDTYVEGTAYVLANDSKLGVGMYKAELNKDAEGNVGTTHFLNNAGKAYMVLPAASETVAFYGLDWDGTTGIEGVEVENEVKAIYDLTGRRVEAITAPGIYIVNGKKVLVK
ncbi:MAG: hypothetical protein IIW77_06670 [Bacteroidaceae bacterium]|nr:hypothetical protein [Bacteroidaceae bacterium]